MKNQTLQYPAQTRLIQLFYYKDGQLLWKTKPNYRKPREYPVIMVDEQRYLEHRLIWIYFNGDIPKGCVVDHIDRDRSNNRIENLRAITQKENTWNRAVKGYHFSNRAKKYIAKIKVHRKTIGLGFYDTAIEARKAYLEGKKKYHKITDYIRIRFDVSRLEHALYKGNTVLGYYPRLTLAENELARLNSKE